MDAVYSMNLGFMFQSIQSDDEIVPWLVHDPSFQIFLVHSSSHHPTLYNPGTENIVKKSPISLF
jgi:hypothetical protein